MSSVIGELDLSEFTFRQRANSLVPDQRLSWRLPLLLLALSYSRAGRSSFPRLAILAYALNTTAARNEIATALDHGRLHDAPIRFEPGFPYLLGFAVASGFIKIVGQSFTLTESGRKLALKCDEQDLFQAERAFLKQHSRHLNETEAKKIIGMDLTDVT